MKSYPFFTEYELECHCGCGKGEMDKVFMGKLIELRVFCNFPFHLSSAFRCDEHNKRVGGTIRSAHLHGRGVDITIAGSNAFKLIHQAANFGMVGIGIRQHGEHYKRMIHLDDLDSNVYAPRPRIWSYS